MSTDMTGLCACCNSLAGHRDSWWSCLLGDRDIVPRVDTDGIAVRLHGTDFLRIERRGTGLHCRIAPEFLLRTHVGARSVVSETVLTPPPRFIASLAEFAAEYAHVRRRVCAVHDRRQAVMDRLFLRHGSLLAVDMPAGADRVDLVGISPEGVVVVWLLRRYDAPDLRLKGRGGIAERLVRSDRWLQSDDCLPAIADQLARMRLLRGPWDRRFARLPAPVRAHPQARLLIVDFDHAQRLGGLPELKTMLRAGLDRTRDADDILAIGDPGNIAHGTLFSRI